MTLQAMHDLFLKERTYLKNSSPKTIASYRESFKAYPRFAPPEMPSKTTALRFVMGMKEKDLKPVTCNVYMRATDAFFPRLFEHEVERRPSRA